MLDRIEGGVHEQQRLVADASHELRTPLAAMRAELDVSLRTDDLSPAAREVLESAREEVDRMSATVEDLLTLASGDEAQAPPLAQPVDLDEVAARATERLRTLAERRGVVLRREGPHVTISGDPDQLGHAVRNVVDNAIKFSPA